MVRFNAVAVRNHRERPNLAVVLYLLKYRIHSFIHVLLRARFSHFDFILRVTPSESMTVSKKLGYCNVGRKLTEVISMLFICANWACQQTLA